MENIFIKETDTTPEISFNYQMGLLEIKGVSIPEDTEEFYKVLLDYIEEYLENPENEQTTILLKLIYVNTSTSAILARIIKFMERLHLQNGHQVTTKWFYEEGDEDMREMGNDFKAFSNIPFNLVSTDEIL
jgi:SiaC family regulatory phosphoprotein